MIGDSAPLPLRKGNALLAIAVGGLIAGALDLTQACILFGWDIPLAIAGGLLGRQAFHGGVGTYILGVFHALLYRLLGSGCLLRGQPQAEFLDGAPIGVWFVLWRSR